MGLVRWRIRFQSGKVDAGMQADQHRAQIAPRTSRATAATVAFYGYFLLAAIVLVTILRPFLTTLVVAAVIAVLADPLYRRMIARWPWPRLMAVVTTFAVVLVVLLPIAWALSQTLVQFGDVAASVAELVAKPRKIPLLDQVLATITELTGIPLQELPTQLQKHMSEGAGTILSIFGRGAREVLGATASMSLNLFILLFAIYTFLLYGHDLVARFKRLSPLNDTLEDELLRAFRGFSYGMVLGSFLTAILQGIIAGIGYTLFGISEAFFWGTMTALFSFVPFVGTAIIWVPLAISLLVRGDTTNALLLALYSALLTGSVDNLVKPWMIGRNSALNPLLLFLSIFGGLMTVGPAGILIGPVTASFFLALAAAYEAAIEPQPDITPTAAVASSDSPKQTEGEGG